MLYKVAFIVYAFNKRCLIFDQIVRLDFEYYFTEYNYDFVTIFDGNSSRALPIISFEGYRSPPPTNIRSTQQYMFLTFTSDDTVTEEGFFTNYTSMPNGRRGVIPSVVILILRT